ncbi:AbgT family transporter [Paenibacillus terreus]|uniref:AbgT family transporter n=1 Tax=Paenibacillus terreus TaxID=1387834 RepID=A0ABV5BEV0_9BACL
MVKAAGTEENAGLFKWVEKVGNKLPNPFLLFIYLIAILMVSTLVLSWFKASAYNPITGEQVHVKNLLSREGIQWMLPNIVQNFASFKPLASILALVMGIGLAEKVRLLEAVMRKMAVRVNARFASYIVIFIAFMSHVSSDAALVIMPPLGALMFLAVGRHPVAGLIAAIAGVGAGFTANILIVTTDVLLSGISTEVAASIDPNTGVTVLDNWYFMSASVIVLTLIAGFMTDKFLEPRLGRYEGEQPYKLEAPTPEENKALRAAGIAALIFIVIMALLVVPANGVLRNPDTGSVMGSPFLSGIVPIILLFFVTVAITYGIKMKVIRTQNDIPGLLMEPIKTMAGFIVMVFPLSQFVAFFNWSNMGQFIALTITDLLEKTGINGIPVIIGLVFLSALLTMFIASGSAIWSILAPVFIPMMMLLGFHPAFTQMIFRVSDSVIIPLAPVSPFVPLFVGFLQEYRKDAKLGTYYSLILPYSIAFFAAWTLMVIIWYLFNLPLGPGAHPRL